jgi:hypothetical protein
MILENCFLNDAKKHPILWPDPIPRDYDFNKVGSGHVRKLAY